MKNANSSFTTNIKNSQAEKAMISGGKKKEKRKKNVNYERYNSV